MPDETGQVAGSIEPSNYNARKTFDPDALRELAQSISVHGLIQPITVRKRGEKGEEYEIICGERRFRACRMLKLCDLIPGIAELVKAGKLTTSAGIVMSKYDKKIQSCYTNNIENIL